MFWNFVSCTFHNILKRTACNCYRVDIPQCYSFISISPRIIYSIVAYGGVFSIVLRTIQDYVYMRYAWVGTNALTS